jgi:putative ABC transport system permease protein
MKRKPHRLPEFAELVFRVILPPEDRLYLVGDYQEIYSRLSLDKGRAAALLWMLKQILRAVPLFLYAAVLGRFAMFKNYLKIALRNICRLKFYTLIKILGLSIGVAACILIYLFIADELSFDRFHDHGDRLYRVVSIRYDSESGHETERQPFMPPPMGAELQRYLSGIEFQSRFTSAVGVARFGDNVFQETVSLVDPSFFEMFTFPLLRGTPGTALADESSVVLTRSLAEKYFGTENPMGRMLTLTFGQWQRDFLVTGVAEDVPDNSSLQFAMVVHIDNLPRVWNNPDVFDEWRRWAFPFFVRLRPGVTPDFLEEGLLQFRTRYFSETLRYYQQEGYDTFRFGLQNIGSLRTDARVDGTIGLAPSYLLAAIALAILLIACVNFMNLSVGLSSVRTVEVGIRKVVGAKRSQLKWQFWGEALLISFAAVVLGVIAADLLLAKFNPLADKQLMIGALFHGWHWAVLPVIAVFCGVFAGGYPALILSSLPPAEILRGKTQLGGGRRGFTKVLVVFQFALSVILVISAVFLGRQTSFLMNRSLGYNSQGLVVILTQENEQAASEMLHRRFRGEVASHSRILSVTASNREFGLFLPSTTLEIGARTVHYNFNRVDPDFLSTMQLELAEGRGFSANPAADRDAVIVNQRFMEQLGPDFQLGSFLGDPSRGFPYNRRVVGIIRDCFIRSLRFENLPLLLYVGQGAAPSRDRFSRMIVRVQTDQIGEIVDYLGLAWKRLQPDKPFIYYFQDQALAGLYESEKRWSAIVRSASFFSILLACLGIFGLTALTLSRREKEIGIRKVLGARFEQIVYLSAREFVALVAVANVIAWPVVYVILRLVLQRYPYRITLHPQYFLLTGFASLLIALLTILYLSVKAALAHPAKSLKYE